MRSWSIAWESWFSSRPDLVPETYKVVQFLLVIEVISRYIEGDFLILLVSYGILW